MSEPHESGWKQGPPPLDREGQRFDLALKDGRRMAVMIEDGTCVPDGVNRVFVPPLSPEAAAHILWHYGPIPSPPSLAAASQEGRDGE